MPDRPPLAPLLPIDDDLDDLFNDHEPEPKFESEPEPERSKAPRRRAASGHTVPLAQAQARDDLDEFLASVADVDGAATADAHEETDEGSLDGLLAARPPARGVVRSDLDDLFDDDDGPTETPGPHSASDLQSDGAVDDVGLLVLDLDPDPDGVIDDGDTPTVAHDADLDAQRVEIRQTAGQLRELMASFEAAGGDVSVWWWEKAKTALQRLAEDL